ncbi:hypothetical protein BC936DRAFT_148990 [Jimgerdemannia flammicorona]|uniref:Uncharacterized protein n=1 Tax=Jimgerdemannia flammicorona TaxID=994334 RepID=A0A433DK89_9FUNG|nr:hypothetical protein BC936DRAFT_148990 [Jimgerdemannia flammicorona]
MVLEARQTLALSGSKCRLDEVGTKYPPSVLIDMFGSVNIALREAGVVLPIPTTYELKFWFKKYFFALMWFKSELPVYEQFRYQKMIDQAFPDNILGCLFGRIRETEAVRRAGEPLKDEASPNNAVYVAYEIGGVRPPMPRIRVYEGTLLMSEGTWI